MILQELMGISCVVTDVVYSTVEGKETLHEGKKKKPFSIFKSHDCPLNPLPHFLLTAVFKIGDNMCPRENKGWGFQMFLWELYAIEFLHADHLLFSFKIIYSASLSTMKLDM